MVNSSDLYAPTHDFGGQEALCDLKHPWPHTARNYFERDKERRLLLKEREFISHQTPPIFPSGRPRYRERQANPPAHTLQPTPTSVWPRRRPYLPEMPDREPSEGGLKVKGGDKSSSQGTGGKPRRSAQTRVEHQAESSTSQAGPSTSQAGPSTSQAGPSTSQAGPSTSQAGPGTVARAKRRHRVRPSANQARSSSAIPGEASSDGLERESWRDARARLRAEADLQRAQSARSKAGPSIAVPTQPSSNDQGQRSRRLARAESVHQAGPPTNQLQTSAAIQPQGRGHPVPSAIHLPRPATGSPRANVPRPHTQEREPETQSRPLAAVQPQGRGHRPEPTARGPPLVVQQASTHQDQTVRRARSQVPDLEVSGGNIHAPVRSVGLPPSSGPPLVNPGLPRSSSSELRIQAQSSRGPRAPEHSARQTGPFDLPASPSLRQPVQRAAAGDQTPPRPAAAPNRGPRDLDADTMSAALNYMSTWMKFRKTTLGKSGTPPRQFSERIDISVVGDALAVFYRARSQPANKRGRRTTRVLNYVIHPSHTKDDRTLLKNAAERAGKQLNLSKGWFKSPSRLSDQKVAGISEKILKHSESHLMYILEKAEGPLRVLGAQWDFALCDQLCVIQRARSPTPTVSITELQALWAQAVVYRANWRQELADTKIHAPQILANAHDILASAQEYGFVEIDEELVEVFEHCYDSWEWRVPDPSNPVAPPNPSDFTDFTDSSGSTDSADLPDPPHPPHPPDRSHGASTSRRA